MNDLLEVLDMSEDEQIRELWNRKKRYLDIVTRTQLEFGRISLADLAFRLRDEMETGQWPQLAEAYEIVRQYWCKVSWALRKRQGYNKKHISSSFFWLFHSKPIHWIIAALIAKGKEDEG